MAHTNTNMFRRTGTDLPEDVSFPADLNALGLKRDLLGHYVQIEHPDEFYQYEQFATKHANDKFHEAVHEAIRNDVYGMLDEMGIKLFHAHDKTVSVHHDIPEEKPKIKLLQGGFDADTVDVYVFIGDSRRELGIFSRLTTATVGGPHEGSVLGIAKALRTESSWSFLPAILVLNPGELLYSYESKSCMTQDTWNTRKRPNAFSEPYAVKEANKVLGHATSREHVKTVLERILPQLLNHHHKRIHIIAIGDGGENVLEYLDEKLTADPETKIGQLALASISLVNSSHDDEKIHSVKLKKFMAKHGRAWVSSPEPRNTILGNVAAEFAEHAQGQDQYDVLSETGSSEKSLVFPKKEAPAVGRARAKSSLSEGIREESRTGGPHNDIGQIEEDVFDDVFYSTSQSEAASSPGPASGLKLPPLISEKYPSMSVPGLTMKDYRRSCDGGAEGRRRSSASIHDTTLANPDQYRISAPSKPIAIPARPRGITNPRAMEHRKRAEHRKTLEDKLDVDSKKALEAMKALQDKRRLEKKEKAFEEKKRMEAKQALEEEILVAEREMNKMAARIAHDALPSTQLAAAFLNDPDRSTAIEVAADPATTTSTEGYDYYGKPCICTTFSAGIEDVTEQLFPAVRHDVMSFIRAQKRRREMKESLKAFRQYELREAVARLGLQEYEEE